MHGRWRHVAADRRKAGLEDDFPVLLKKEFTAVHLNALC